MKLNGSIVGVDGLGVLVEGARGSRWYRRLPYDLVRIAKDVPLDPPLAQEPAHEDLVKGAAQILVTKESIFYLEAQPRSPFNSRLLYLPIGERPTPAPKVLTNEAYTIVGEWEGWVYALRRRPGFDHDGLGPKQAQAVGNDRSALDDFMGASARDWWRFRYDLLRARLDGTTEVIGEVPRTVDSYFDGYVYGRSYDHATKELGVFRIRASGGAPEVLFERKREISAYGGNVDSLGEVAVDRDGIFVADHGKAELLKIAHAGGAPEALRQGAAQRVHSLESYLVLEDWEYQRVLRKDGGTVSWHSSDGDPLFAKGSGLGERWSSAFDGNVQYVMGRRWYCPDPHSYECDIRPLGFVYEYLPGGTINARRFPLREGHAWTGQLGMDEDCLYYTRTDDANTWLYALPKPSIR
jgi:hypothetical protein